MFEKAEYIGGRSTVVWPWEEDPEAIPLADAEQEEPVECGASIFVSSSREFEIGRS